MKRILVVDLARVLDESEVGQAASEVLTAQFEGLRGAWEEKKTESADLGGAEKANALAELARMEDDAMQEIEGKREALRSQLLARVRPAVAHIAKKEDADYVIEKGAVLFAASDKDDITKRVMALVDKKGPLEA